MIQTLIISHTMSGKCPHGGWFSKTMDVRCLYQAKCTNFSVNKQRNVNLDFSLVLSNSNMIIRLYWIWHIFSRTFFVRGNCHSSIVSIPQKTNIFELKVYNALNCFVLYYKLSKAAIAIKIFKLFILLCESFGLQHNSDLIV